MVSRLPLRLSKNLLIIKNWVSLIACSVGFASCKTFGKQPKHPCFGAKPPTGTRGGSPSNIAPSHGEGVWGFGKDAEIRTHQALHDAKPSECPKGDRDNKSEVYFKNRLFLQAAERLITSRFFCLLLLFTSIGIIIRLLLTKEKSDGS